ncbi:MAG: hypothetical protein ACXW5U_07075 [Thermoanaerobaculia bacterium]
MRRVLKYALIALGAAAVLHSGIWVVRALGSQPAVDFYIYYVAADLDARSDVEDIYGPDVQSRIGEEEYARALSGSSRLQKLDAADRRRLDNVSSPFLYTCFTWLPRDYDLALGIFRTLLVVAFGAGVVILGVVAGLPWAAALFLSAALLRFFFPFHTEVIVGNVNAFQLFAIALFAAFDRRFPAIGGAIIVLLVAFKPTLAWMIVVLVVSRLAVRDFARLRRELAGGTVGGLFAFGAAALNFGSPRVWLQWIPVASGFYGRLPGREANNVAPALPLFESVGSSLSLIIASLLLIVVTVLLFRFRSRNNVLLAGLGALVYILSAPVVWLFYLTLAIPAAVALLRNGWTGVVAVAALFAMSGQWLFLMGHGAQPLDWRVITPALLALFAASLWHLAAPRVGVEPQPESTD